jgi:hypothetical protein
VIRQVELEGPELTPIAAVSLAEWQRAHDAGRLDEYDSRFGITAELPVSEWEGHDPEQLTSEEFEEVGVLPVGRSHPGPADLSAPRGLLGIIAT